MIEIGKPNKRIPQTVDEFVNEMINGLSIRERNRIANMDEDQWKLSDEPMVQFIAHRLRDRPYFKELMKDCIAQTGNDSLDEVQAAAFIIKEFWKKLRDTHKLRIVK